MNPSRNFSTPSRKRSKRAPFDHFSLLPDEMVEQILCLLPAKYVLRYQLVCQRWKNLTSSQSFVLMHMQRCDTPLMLVMHYILSNATNETACLDRWWNPPTKCTVKYTLKRLRWKERGDDAYYHRLLLSYDGLLLLKRRRMKQKSVFVFNLIRNEKVEIVLPPNPTRVHVFGMFWHPLLKEYGILFGIFPDISESNEKQFKMKMVVLGPKAYWKDIPCKSGISYKPRIDASSPVVVDDVLYWLPDHTNDTSLWPPDPNDDIGCKESIIAFDIKSEEFTVMPHPFSPIEPRCNHRCMNLLKVGGCLSLVHIISGQSSFDVNIWTLKDGVTSVWAKDSTCTFNTALNSLAKMPNVRVFATPIAIMGTKLMILLGKPDHSKRKLFICDLQLCTTPRRYWTWHNGSGCGIYQPSLVSLKNWKRRVSIDKEKR